MKKQLLYFILFFCLIGCSPIYYIPNTQNVPLFKKEKEFSGTILGKNDKSVSEFEMQFAYSPQNNLGVMVNYFSHDTKKDNDGDFGNGNFTEIGVGYYKIQNKLNYAIYGLLGSGNFYNNFGVDTTLEGKFLKNSVLVLSGYEWNYFEVALSARISNLHYKNISGQLKWDNENQKNYLEENNNYWLFEPAITMRAGGEHVKFQLQYYKSFNLTNKNFRQQKDGLTIGLYFIFDLNKESFKY